MKQNTLLWIVLGILIAGALFFFFQKQNSSQKMNDIESVDMEADVETMDLEEIEGSSATDTPTTSSMPSTDTTTVPAESVNSAVQEFVVTGSNTKFDVTQIKVKQGDTVRVVFKNAEGMHDWVLDEFGAKTNTIRAGASETVEFVASKKGTFEYYCSVGNHRAAGMVGTLTVE